MSEATLEVEEHEPQMVHLAVPNLEDGAPALTDEQIKFGLANHALCMQQLIKIINAQDETITTLLFVMAAYMKQYPLDVDVLARTEKPAPTGQYL